jgi:hypothetical protein
LDEIIQIARTALGGERLEVVGKEPRAGQGLGGASLKEIVEFLVFAEEFFERG